MSVIELLSPCKTQEDGFAAAQDWAATADKETVAAIAGIPVDRLLHPRVPLSTEDDPEEFIGFTYDDDLTREALIGFVVGVRTYHDKQTA